MILKKEENKKSCEVIGHSPSPLTTSFTHRFYFDQTVLLKVEVRQIYFGSKGIFLVQRGKFNRNKNIQFYSTEIEQTHFWCTGSKTVSIV